MQNIVHVWSIHWVFQMIFASFHFHVFLTPKGAQTKKKGSLSGAKFSNNWAPNLPKAPLPPLGAVRVPTVQQVHADFDVDTGVREPSHSRGAGGSVPDRQTGSRPVSWLAWMDEVPCQDLWNFHLVFRDLLDEKEQQSPAEWSRPSVPGLCRTSVDKQVT